VVIFPLHELLSWVGGGGGGVGILGLVRLVRS